MVIGTKGDNSVGKSFDLRNPYDDGICLDFLGSPGWPRFAIQDERKKLFWTGTGWTSDRKKALLYADLETVLEHIWALKPDIIWVWPEDVL